MTSEKNDLVVRDLHKEYPTPGEPLVIVSGISFAMNRGEALVIMGPSGSGKSTLLYMLGALEKPTRGEVLVDSRNPFTLSEPELAKFRNRQVGFIFQEHHLLPQCTALENVLIPTMAPGAELSADESERRARKLLDRVGLHERIGHRPAELSGGERQRVSIARALIHHATLLLADEPTGNLDRKTAESVADLILELHREENTILITVTHSLELAKRFARRAELVDGRLAL